MTLSPFIGATPESVKGITLGGGVGPAFVEADGFGPFLGREGEEDFIADDIAQADEYFSDEAALLALDLERLLDMTLVDELHQLEDLPQRLVPVKVVFVHAGLRSI